MKKAIIIAAASCALVFGIVHARSPFYDAPSGAGSLGGAASSDIDMSGNDIDNAASITSNAADPADTCVLRLGNGATECIGAEASPTGTDGYIYYDSNEAWHLSNGVFIDAGPSTFPAGDVTNKAIAFTGSNNSGFYSTGSNNVTAAIGGGIKMQWTAAGTTLAAAMNANANAITAVSNFQSTGTLTNTPTAVTIADSGGAGAAAATLTTPVSTNYRYTCSDADGCTLTLGETSVSDGQRLEVHNVGTNFLTMSDSSGVQELPMNLPVRMGQYDSIRFIYHSDRWQEAGDVQSDGYMGQIAATPDPDSPTVIAIATQDVFVEVNRTTTLDADSGSCFSQVTSGRLQYNCPATMTFHCAFSLSWRSDSGSFDARARLTDNGTTIADSEIFDTISATDWDSTALHEVVTLSQGQYVSVAVANHSGVADIQVGSVNIVCLAHR